MKRLLALALLAASTYNGVAQQEHKCYPIPLRSDAVRAIDIKAWEPSTPNVTLPSYVDNSKLPYFPAVFEQRGGSCAQSSGIRYLFTYEMNRVRDVDAQASDENTYSYFYTWDFVNEGKDQGGFAEQGLNIARSQGVMSLADLPDPSSYFYFPWASGYDKYLRSMHNRVKEIISFDVTDQEGLDKARRYLYDAGDGSKHGGILSFSTLAEGWKIETIEPNDASGYRSVITRLATDGAHAMTIVGYDDTVKCTIDGTEQTGAFIIVNSYGTWWADKGHCYLPYYFFLQSDRSALQLSHDVTGCSCVDFDPQVVFRVKVSYDSRNDLAFIMGVADKPYATVATVSVNSAIASNQGGDHPMCGSYGSNTIEMAFDFSDAVSRYASYSEPKYFLTVTRSEIGTLGSGTLDAFSVVDYRSGTPKEYRCELDGPVTLEKGANIFTVATTPLRTTSANATGWVDNLGVPYTSPFALLTAAGNYAKLQVLNYDRTTKQLTIRYLYQGNGSRDLNTLK